MLLCGPTGDKHYESKFDDQLHQSCVLCGTEPSACQGHHRSWHTQTVWHTGDSRRSLTGHFYQGSRYTPLPLLINSFAHGLACHICDNNEVKNSHSWTKFELEGKYLPRYYFLSYCFVNWFLMKNLINFVSFVFMTALISKPQCVSVQSMARVSPACWLRPRLVPSLSWRSWRTLWKLD